MDMMVDKMLNKINVKVAPYALLDVLRALYNSDVKEVTITKEDNELVLVVDTSRNFGHGCYVKVDENGYPDVSGSISATDSPYEIKATGVTLHG